MKKLWKILSVLIKILGVIGGIVFVIYYRNLDQKRLGWPFDKFNRIFDRKKSV